MAEATYNALLDLGIDDRIAKVAAEKHPHSLEAAANWSFESGPTYSGPLNNETGALVPAQRPPLTPHPSSSRLPSTAIAPRDDDLERALRESVATGQDTWESFSGPQTPTGDKSSYFSAPLPDITSRPPSPGPPPLIPVNEVEQRKSKEEEELARALNMSMEAQGPPSPGHGGEGFMGLVTGTGWSPDGDAVQVHGPAEKDSSNGRPKAKRRAPGTPVAIKASPTRPPVLPMMSLLLLLSRMPSIRDRILSFIPTSSAKAVAMQSEPFVGTWDSIITDSSTQASGSWGEPTAESNEVLLVSLQRLFAFLLLSTKAFILLPNESYIFSASPLADKAITAQPNDPQAATREFIHRLFDALDYARLTSSPSPSGVAAQDTVDGKAARLKEWSVLGRTIKREYIGAPLAPLSADEILNGSLPVLDLPIYSDVPDGDELVPALDRLLASGRTEMSEDVNVFTSLPDTLLVLLSRTPSPTLPGADETNSQQRRLFKIPEVWSADRWMSKNRAEAATRREVEAALKTEEGVLREQKRVVEGDGGIEKIKRAFEYLTLAKPAAEKDDKDENEVMKEARDVKRAALYDIYKQALEALEKHIAELDEQLAVNSKAQKDLWADLNDWEYRLDGVLHRTGLVAPKQYWANVRASDFDSQAASEDMDITVEGEGDKERSAKDDWWRIIGTRPDKVSLKSVLGDMSGIHWNAGPYLLAYTRVKKTSQEVKDPRSLIPSFLVEAIEADNQDFEAKTRDWEEKDASKKSGEVIYID